MAKATIDIRSLARQHTKSAINTLASIMTSEHAPEGARVQAAVALLDRGWGKPTQPVGDEEGAVTLIHRIERIIVDTARGA